MRDQAMSEDVTLELKQALTTVIATAASMGIDVDILCQEAGRALRSDDQMNWIKPYIPGAIDQIRQCRDLAKGF
jgi:uncharacterized protein (DUF2252 family)